MVHKHRLGCSFSAHALKYNAKFRRHTPALAPASTIRLAPLLSEAQNAPVRDYGVTLVLSPRQPGWLTGNPAATGHLGVEAWKMFCMLQQSLWSQSGKRHRWFFTQKLSGVCQACVACRIFIVFSTFLKSLRYLNPTHLLTCNVIRLIDVLIVWLHLALSSIVMF